MEEVQRKPSLFGLDAKMAILDEHGYEYKKEIGRGGQASVHLVRSRKYNQLFAAKIMTLRESKSGKDPCEAELNSLLKLHHPNIISLYDHFAQDGYRFLILEYCPLGSLDEKIRKEGPLPSPVAKNYFLSIAGGLTHCHQCSIAHRDIKPSNILIDINGRPKLADFGLGVECQTGEKMPSDSGSLLFSPPEFIRMKPLDPFKADIWSLGTVLYAMIAGKLPWSKSPSKVILEEIMRGLITYDDAVFSRDAIVLLESMLSVAVSERPNIEAVLRSEYCQGRIGIVKASSHIVCDNSLVRPTVRSLGLAFANGKNHNLVGEYKATKPVRSLKMPLLKNAVVCHKRAVFIPRIPDLI